MTDFNLSDKAKLDLEDEYFHFHEEDVKEFIRLLKEEWNNWGRTEEVLEFSDIIDKLAGSALI